MKVLKCLNCPDCVESIAYVDRWICVGSKGTAGQYLSDEGKPKRTPKWCPKRVK